MNAPCYKCADRYVNCHSECDRYKKWRSEYARKTKQINQQRKMDAIFRDHIHRAQDNFGRERSHSYKKYRK